MKELKFDRARFDAGEMPTRTRGGAKVHWCAATGLKDEFRAFVAIVGNNSVAVAYDSDGCSVSGSVYYDLVHEPRMTSVTVGIRRILTNPPERLTAERDELRRQLAEAEQDARRYQWLRRAREHWDILHRYDEDSRWIDLHGNDLDATIDSAMGGGNE